MPIPASHTYTNAEGRTWTVQRLIEAADAESGNSYSHKVADLMPANFASVWGSKVTERDEMIAHVQRILTIARDWQDNRIDKVAPVLLDSEGNVLDGFHRLLFAAAVGQHTIECRTLRVMPPDDETAYLLDEYTRRADAVVTQSNWAWQTGLAVVPKMGTIKRRLLVLEHSDRLTGINGFGLMLLDDERHVRNVHPADYRLDLTHELTRLYVLSLETVRAGDTVQGCRVIEAPSADPHIGLTPAYDPALQDTGPSPDQPLPCNPCVHKGACCKYGASLTVGEAVALDAVALDAGQAEGVLVSHDNSFGCSDPYRTKLRPHPIHGEACVFLTGEGVCSIHDKPYYPKTCQGFPWLTNEGAPYPHDKTICPEFVQITEPTRKKD